MMNAAQLQAVHLTEINNALKNPGDLTKLRDLLFKHAETLKTNPVYQQDLYSRVNRSAHPHHVKVDLICTLAIHDMQFSDAQFETIIKPIFNDKNVFHFWSYPAKTRFWELFDVWIKVPGHRNGYKALLATAFEHQETSAWYKILAIPRSWRFQPHTNNEDTTHVSSLDTLEARYNLWIKDLDPRIEALKRQQAPSDSAQEHHWLWSRLRM